jgi:hypothetical protein
LEDVGMAVSVASEDPAVFIEQVRSLLSYDKETGVFTWKVNRKCKAMAGTVAGNATKKKGLQSSIMINVFDKKYPAHKLAFMIVEGRMPDGVVLHRDKDARNNKWDNLYDSPDVRLKKDEKPTQEWLKEILNYDPETGLFVWKIGKGPVKDRIDTVAGCVHETHAGKKYIRIHIDGKMYRAHRLAWLYMTGADPLDQIDHEDGNGENNRFLNLCEATNTSNAKNRRKRSDNSSGVTGVRFNKAKNKFVATITDAGKLRHVGQYNTLEEAASARKAAEEKFGYHKNHGSERPL